MQHGAVIGLTAFWETATVESEPPALFTASAPNYEDYYRAVADVF